MRKLFCESLMENLTVHFLPFESEKEFLDVGKNTA